MRSLGLALFAEGPSDYRFLSPVLRRLTEDVCSHHARYEVDVGSVLDLRAPTVAHRDLETKILEAAREASGAFDVLFIHQDGGGDPQADRAQRVEPASRLIEDELSGRHHRTVGVVPVREMEAWTLVDGDALRGAFGANLSDTALGLPGRAAEVERILDPKENLERSFAMVVGVRRRRRTPEHFLEVIGEQVKLGSLRQVPAFRSVEQDLQSALMDLGYLTP